MRISDWSSDVCSSDRLAEGALGLPVFAGTPEKGLGLAYMAGPTGGYLVGYVLAAAACGWLAERGWDRNVLSATVAMLVGNALIYLPGLLWLGVLFGWDKPILEWGDRKSTRLNSSH